MLAATNIKHHSVCVIVVDKPDSGCWLNKPIIVLILTKLLQITSNAQYCQQEKVDDTGRQNRVYVLTVRLWRVTFAESLPPSFSTSHAVSHKGNSKHGRMRLTGQLQTRACVYSRIAFPRSRTQHRWLWRQSNISVCSVVFDVSSLFTVRVPFDQLAV